MWLHSPKVLKILFLNIIKKNLFVFYGIIEGNILRDLKPRGDVTDKTNAVIWNCLPEEFREKSLTLDTGGIIYIVSDITDRQHEGYRKV